MKIIDDCPDKLCRSILVVVLLSAVAAFACRRNSTVKVSPAHFKVQTPFMFDRRGIIVNTYWGAEHSHHVLCLDNLSPTWIDSTVFSQDKKMVKSSEFNFRTYAADGTKILGSVGISDSVFFEGVKFEGLMYYVMPEKASGRRNDDGVFGGDLMAKGIWQINFKTKELIFTSDLDSLNLGRGFEILPAVFGDGSITVEITLQNGASKRLQVDLGYNGDVILPLDEFKAISTGSNVFSRSDRFMTPASGNQVKDLFLLDTVKINRNWFTELISSNELIKEHLAGIQFFQRFDVVVFDFLHRRIYVPRKVW